MENKDIKDKVSLSIIIATYNAGNHISDCLLSVLALEQENMEIVIVDGGSTDNTLEIIKRYTTNNNKVSCVSEPDAGIYDALNKGVKRAKGKWLYFMGADDRLLPGFKALAAMLKDEGTIYYGDTEGYYEGADPGYLLLTGKFTSYRLAKYCMNHQAIIYPAKVFEQYRYELQYKVLADYALNIKLWGDRRFKKQHYHFNIARYCMNGFSAAATDIVFKKDKPRMIRKYMGWFIYLRYCYKEYKLKMKNKENSLS
jgi:glycosyltransferase involved in cell wall biosynthesis